MFRLISYRLSQYNNNDVYDWEVSNYIIMMTYCIIITTEFTIRATTGNYICINNMVIISYFRQQATNGNTPDGRCTDNIIIYEKINILNYNNMIYLPPRRIRHNIIVNTTFSSRETAIITAVQVGVNCMSGVGITDLIFFFFLFATDV